MRCIVKWINDLPTQAYEVEGTIDFAQRHSSRSRCKVPAWFTWEGYDGEHKFAGRTGLKRKDVRDLMLMYTDGDGRFGIVNSQSPAIATSEALALVSYEGSAVR